MFVVFRVSVTVLIGEFVSRSIVVFVRLISLGEKFDFILEYRLGLEGFVREWICGIIKDFFDSLFRVLLMGYILVFVWEAG